MNIIGLSALYHDSACCLIRDSELIAAAQEERFTRVKNEPRIPVRAFRWCLEAGGIDVCDVDIVAYYEKPVRKLSRQLWSGPPRVGQAGLAYLDPSTPQRLIAERLGIEGGLQAYSHHRSHAASAYLFSNYDDAAVLVADAVGEWATTSYGHGRGTDLELFEQVHFPHSLGLLYATITAYLGFEVNEGEYKVMGLAAYGQPRYVDAFSKILASGPQGQFRLAPGPFDFVRGAKMFGPELLELLGGPPRAPADPIDARHQDIAHSLQRVLEDTLLEKLELLQRRTGSRSLCMAGGVALNCVANGRIAREGPFERVFVQPAAGDAGGALGAAALALVHATGERPKQPAAGFCPNLGPQTPDAKIAELLRATQIPHVDHRDSEACLVDAVARRLADGEVIGWMQGALEFGPRALGARSILADPRRAESRDRINAAVKRRESFRPFAPSVLADAAGEFFELDHPSPYMLETCGVKPGLPAVTHIDGSARPQTVGPLATPRFAALLRRFEELTGCPALLNTSFNVRGEPIVADPSDALCCMLDADLDGLALGSFFVDAGALSPRLRELLPVCRARQRSGVSPVHSGLYTFV